ncbi:MAG: hypothetical protein E4G90_10860 [Gemmatimonadales bacterium]|nr:MAG: hypothetical protein E4G90_10860 [Gemmatimonadales bacterium]
MFTPKKITMYSVNPEDPEDRTVLAVFELKGDKVDATFHGPNAKDLEAEMERDGLYDSERKRYLRPKDGADFMQFFPSAYPRASFVAIEVD